MYSFDGDFKPKRSINLGGDRHNQSKQSLLEQAREQRRLRNEQRIQNEASLKIQSAVKEFLFKKRVQKEQYEIFKTFSTPKNSEEFQVYLKSFLLSFPPPNWFLKNTTSGYHKLLFSLLPDLVQVSSLEKNSQILILEPFKSSNNLEWGAIVNRLVRYILLQRTIPKEQFLFIIKLLQGVASIQKSDAQLGLLKTCLKFNIFNHIKNEIQKSEDFTYLIEFLIIPLDFGYDNDFKFSYFNHFCISILTLEGSIPYLNSILNSFQSKLLHSNSVLTLIESFINSINQTFISDIDKVFMVYNLSNLINFGNILSFIDNTDILIELFKTIVMNLSFESNFITSQNEYELLQFELTLTQEEKHSDNEDFERISQNNTHSKPPNSKTDTISKKLFISETILSHIKLFLVSTNILHTLILNIDKSDESLIQFSEFVVILLFKWPSISRELISNLLYNINFSNINLIKRLYEYWTNLNLHAICTEKPIYSELFKSTINIRNWITLVLLSECLSQHMVAIGDEESVTELLNLELHHLLNITVILRNITFYLYWNEIQIDLKTPIQGIGITWSWIRKRLTKLVSQLYDRDSRSNFTGEDFWVARWNSDLANVFYVNAARELYSDSQSLDELEETTESKRHSSMLSLLKNIPFTLPFKERVMVFSKIIEFDKDSIPPQYFDFNHSQQVARIRRGRALEDGFLKLNHLGNKMKGLIKIEFISELGLPEIGIDGGGVFKEFLNSVIKQAFDTNYGLFLHTPQRYLYPNPHTYSSEDSQLEFYEFLGRIVGKALYEGILVNAPLARFFIAKWLGQQSYFNDLPSLDLELYRGLKVLKGYKGDVEADFGLNFTLSNQEFGEASTVELIPNGSNISVTKENRIKYTYLVADYRLNRQIRRQSASFLKGLNDLIHPSWLKLFHATELQLLVGGQTQPIDIEDFKKNTTYSGVYDEYHPVILAFWDVVEELNQEDRARLLEFITSCPRPPMLGFAQLNPPLCIRSSETDDNRLPTASTCVNLLKLPVFTSRDILKDKLIYAINSGAGFELS